MSDFLEIQLTTSIPTNAQVPYTAPRTPSLLSLLVYFVLLALPTMLSNTYPIPESSSIASFNKEKTPKSTSHISNSQQSYTLNPALTLLLPLLLGALFGPSISSNSIISTSTQRTLMDIGYIGVLFLIFEAGVSLDAKSLKLMRTNAGLSTLAALTGVLVPIALSMGLGMGAYGYTGLQAFASGASLCSTSLGTTLALLSSSGTPPHHMDLKKTRVGCVLVCAALLDDIIGLVIAGIIPGLAQTAAGDGAQLSWPVIVRPILVSFAFGIGTPVAAMAMRRLIRLPWHSMWNDFVGVIIYRHRERMPQPRPTLRNSTWSPLPQVLFIIIILTIMGFVAGSTYAGTSELFGAYLGGAFVGHIFEEQVDSTIQSDSSTSNGPNISGEELITEQSTEVTAVNPAHFAFTVYLQPILTHFLAPLFFASIGAALPIKAMFATHPSAVQISFMRSDNTTITEIVNGEASHRVIWRGSVYAVLMVIGKMVVGVWMLIWPDPSTKSQMPPRQNVLRRFIHCSNKWFKTLFTFARQRHDDPHLPRATPSGEGERANFHGPVYTQPSRLRSALLLGLAMVSRGEIALIIAQLARPLLIGPTPTPTLSTTIFGGESVTSTTTPLPDEEPFAVVIWAILLSTVGGALGVGALISSWEKGGDGTREGQADAQLHPSIGTVPVPDDRGKKNTEEMVIISAV